MEELVHRVAQKSDNFKVGFYGCTNQLVRVGVVARKGRRLPQSAMLDCPACGRTHPAKNFMWRLAHSEQEYQASEVHLEEGEDDSE